MFDQISQFFNFSGTVGVGPSRFFEHLPLGPIAIISTILSSRLPI